MRGLVAIVFAMSALIGTAHAQWPVRAMNKQIDQTNFLIDNDCSGTLIDKDERLILTASHCIAAHYDTVSREEVDKDGTVKEIKVRVTKPGTVSQIDFAGANEVHRSVFVYRVKANDPHRDLGLIQVVAKLPNTMQAPVACEAPDRGDTVYAVGNPFAVLYSTVTKGIVASVARDYRMLGIDGNGDDEQPGDNGLMQITAPIEGGNSGGAAYNDAGELIGVNVRASQVNETVAFAVPLEDVRKFLTENNVTLPACLPD